MSVCSARIQAACRICIRGDASIYSFNGNDIPFDANITRIYYVFL